MFNFKPTNFPRLANLFDQENHQITTILSLIFIVIFLCFPSAALIQEYFGLLGIVTHVIIVASLLLLILKFKDFLFQFIPKWYPILVGLTFLGLVVIFSVVYPLETQGIFSQGSDRDEALNIAVDKLLQGQYPYYEETPIGGKITPLPGAILLSVPFCLLGNSAYQNLFWLPAFLYVSSIYFVNKISALILFLSIIVFSPAVQYEFISGGDLLANSIYVSIFTFFTIQALASTNASKTRKIIAVILLSLGLASRSNFLFLLPMLFAILTRVAGKKSAIVCTAGILLLTISLILPFYLFDPNSFAPFSVGNKLEVLNSFFQFSSHIIILSTFLLSIIFSLVLKQISDLKIVSLFFFFSGIIQLFPILCAIILSSLDSGHLNLSFLHDRYGLMCLFLGVWGCWPYFIPNE